MRLFYFVAPPSSRASVRSSGGSSSRAAADQTIGQLHRPLRGQARRPRGGSSAHTAAFLRLLSGQPGPRPTPHPGLPRSSGPEAHCPLHPCRRVKVRRPMELALSGKSIHRDSARILRGRGGFSENAAPSFSNWICPQKNINKGPHDDRGILKAASARPRRNLPKTLRIAPGRDGSIWCTSFSPARTKTAPALRRVAQRETDRQIDIPSSSRTVPHPTYPRIAARPARTQAHIPGSSLLPQPPLIALAVPRLRLQPLLPSALCLSPIAVRQDSLKMFAESLG